MSDSVDPSKLKVAELRAELTARGLDSKGNKPVLVERLREALAAEQENQEPENDDQMKQLQAEDQPEEPMEAEKEQEEQQEQEQQEQEELQDDVKEAEEINGENCEEQNKDDYEEAPVEQFDEDEEKLEEPEDKSAVDLIKEDFFNGHTEDLQGLEEEDIKEEDADVKPAVEAGQEDASAAEVKTEADAAAAPAEAEPEPQEDESWDHKRGRKRAGSPVKTEPDTASNAKKIRPDADVCIISGQDDSFDKSLLVLDWYNSDLSLKIDQTTRLSACPMSDKSFCYMWHGVRGTYGFTEGRVFFEVSLIRHCEVPQLEESEQHPYVVRLGWSVDDSTFTLGEEPNSWGYGGTGKASTDLKFKDYGCSFKVGDVVGAYLDLDAQPMVMSFTVNGVHQGIAYEINKEDLDGQALFPHILTKNIEFKVNFGTEEPAYEPLEGYTMAGLVPLSDRIQGSQGPASRSECEVIMMVGLPAAGKTVWVQNYCRENRHMKYNVLGSNDLIDKMKVQGMKRKRNYAGRWDQLISSCMRSLNDLLHMAYNRPRNYIIDQTNVYPTAQKRKMRGFAGFKRRAVVICPTDEDLKQRTLKREKEEGKDVPDSAVLEMKANFKLPEVGDFFDSVEFIEMSCEESQRLIETYNKEGQAACPNKFNNRNDGGRDRRDYNDRGGRDNYRSGSYNNNFRGGWDRDRDRRGSYDRRDRGGWNRNNNRDISSRLGSGGGGGGGGGGYNRDNRSGGGSSGGYNRDNRGGYNRGGGFRDNRGGGRNYQSSGGNAGGYNKYQDGGYQGNNSWNQSGSGSQYNQNYGGYGQQGAAYSAPSYGTTTASGYGQTGGYGWSQQQPQSYYGQQAGGAQSYYSQSYRNDTANTPAATNTWGAASPASNTWSQGATWGQTPPAAAAAPAAPVAPAHGTWGSSTYSQPAAQQSWSHQGYSGYYGRK
ncbi:SAP domain [Trinorchestia longiramus]|nr:SAP domain [Trinorchestia longiramus]